MVGRPFLLSNGALGTAISHCNGQVTWAKTLSMERVTVAFPGSLWHHCQVTDPSEVRFEAHNQGRDMITVRPSADEATGGA